MVLGTLFSEDQSLRITPFITEIALYIHEPSVNLVRATGATTLACPLPSCARQPSQEHILPSQTLWEKA